MKFTIGIPVHNGEQYLREAIVSVLSQSRPADEILVIDDASTDGSAAVVHSNEWSGKIRYVFNDKPTGWVDAFNRILELAKGDFVIILGCDDFLNENFLYHVEQALEKFPSARFCYTGYNIINEKGDHLWSSPEPHLTGAVLYSGADYSSKYLQGVFSDKHINRFLGVAIERDLLLKDCPLRKEAGLIADDDLFVRLGAFTDVIGISQPLGCVRYHAMSLTGRIESLAMQLAEDYLFQVRDRKAHLHLEPQDIEIYNCLEARFINELMFNGLLSGKHEWVLKAISLRIAFEKEVPDFMNNALSFKSNLMWKLVRSGSGVHMQMYNNIIQLARGLKRSISK